MAAARTARLVVLIHTRSQGRKRRPLISILLLASLLGLLLSVDRAAGGGTGGPTISGESALIAISDDSGLQAYAPSSGSWTTVSSDGSTRPNGWSPDHSKLAYVDGTKLYLWDGSTSTQLYDFSSIESFVTPDALDWSPDGEDVAWTLTGCEECDEPGVIGVTNVVSDSTTVFDDTTTGDTFARVDGLSWSPDGRDLAFAGPCESGCTDTDDSHSNLYELDVATGSVIALTSGSNWFQYPIWSPDGTQVVYQDWFSDGTNYHLCHVPAPGVSGTASCFSYGDDPGYSGYAYAPNGDLASLDIDGTLFIDGTQKGSTDAFAGAYLGWQSWSPDSTYLLLDAGYALSEEILVTASSGSSTSLGSPFGSTYSEVSWANPLAPLPVGSSPGPEDGATITTCGNYPVLSASPSSDLSSVSYEFEVATDSGFGTIVSDSGALPSTDTFSPAPGSLAQGTTYYWRWRIGSGAWSLPRSFTLQQANLGAAGPTWSDGPLAVNEQNGNLLVSLPGPSFPSAVGSLAASLSYNSQTSADQGLGAGWALDTGASDNDVPLSLLDLNAVASMSRLDAVQALNSDGSSSCYSHVSETNTYVAQPGDGTQLTKATNGTWTYTSADSVATYSADDSNGVARLTGIESTSATAGIDALTYTYSSTDPTKLTQVEDASGRTLTLTWHSLDSGGCNTAIVCIEGPDGQTWKLVGDSGSGTTGRLASVWDGTRTIAAVSYSGGGLVDQVQNADDLDSADASAGYNSSHALTVSYDGSSRVDEVDNGPISDQTPDTSTWTFGYHPGSVPLTATRAAHDDLSADTVRTAAGYTTITPPNQQGAGSPADTKVYWDDHGNVLERDDLLGHVTEAGFNGRDEQTWSEDEDGNPTDYGWDTVNDVLLSETDPDPDGSGPDNRPVTSYRYDEEAIGTSSTTGTALEGLAASYYSNVNLAGRPTAQETDPAVDFDWGTSGPPALTATTNYSVRWTGDLMVSETGDYTFSTNASDGTRLIVDGIAAIDNWVDQTETAVFSQPISLSAGVHRVELDYYDHTDSSHVHLEWACSGCSPTIGSEVIPATALAPAWLDQTSTVSPSGRIAFSHFDHPWTGNPDYTLVEAPINGSSSDLITSYTYDTAGRLTGKVMPKGNNSASIDTDGTLTDAGDPTSNNYGTSYTYYGNSATASPPSPCTSGNAVNQAGQLETKSEHGLHNQTSVYDAAGDTIASTDAAGTTCNTYTDEGRLETTTAPSDSNATSYSYDPAGNTLEVTHSGTSDDTRGTVTTVYDEAGRVRETTDANGAEAAYSYDADGNVLTRAAATTSLSATHSDLTSYTYDVADELTSETNPAGQLFSFFHDDRGDLQGTQYPNKTFSWTDTDPDGNVSDLFNRHGVINSTSTVPPADPNPIGDYNYGYSSDGQQTSQTTVRGQAPLLDTFDRDDLSVPPSANWSNQIEPGDSTMQDAASDLAARADDNEGSMWWNQRTYGPDSEAYVTMTTSAGSGNGTYLFVRLTSPGTSSVDGYAMWQVSWGGTYLFRITNASWTQIGFWNGDSATAGESDMLTAVGNRITAYRRPAGATSWTQIGDVTDTAHTGAGYIGTGIDYDTGRLDNFGGGTITAPPIAILDTFNRNDSTSPPTSEWSNQIESGDSTMNDAGTDLAAESNGNQGSMWWNEKTYGPDSEAFVTLKTLPGSGNGTYLFVRITNPGTSSLDGYAMWRDSTGGYTHLYRITNATWTQIGNWAGPAASAGESYMLTATGSTIAVYRRAYGAITWQPVGSATDTTYSGAGYIGAGIDYSTGRLDDFGGGTLDQQTTGYTYDDGGRLSTVTNPDGSSERYCYDADSNRTYLMDASSDSCGSSGATSTYTYTTGTHTPVDALTAQTGPSHTYSYDGAGSTNGDGMITGNGTDTYNWDSQLRLQGSIETSGSVCYRFSPDGTLKTRIYDSGGNSTCTTATTTTNYLLGDLYETNAAGDTTTANTDSPEGDLATTNGPATNNWTLVGSVTDTTYTGAGYIGTGIDYDAGRLDNFGGGTTSIQPIPILDTFNRDDTTSPPSSNWTSQLQLGDSTMQDAASDYAAEADGNEGTMWWNTQTYGPNSEAFVTLKTLPGSGNGTYLFTRITNPGTTSLDGYAMWTDSSGTTHLYKITNTTYTQIGSWTGTAPTAGESYMLTAVGTTISAYRRAASTAFPTYIYYNAHGDVTAETDTDGDVTATDDYDPFGVLAQSGPVDQTAHRYTGRWSEQLDTTSSLILMGARPYDPTTGRFYEVDPIDGGSLNNYDYAGQDPVNRYDLDGACWTGFCWAKHAVHWSQKKATAALSWAKAHPYQAVMVGAGVACIFATGGTATMVCVLGVGGISAAMDIYHQDKTGQSIDLAGVTCAVAEGAAKGTAKLLDHVCGMIAGAVGVNYGVHR